VLPEGQDSRLGQGQRPPRLGYLGVTTVPRPVTRWKAKIHAPKPEGMSSNS